MALGDVICSGNAKKSVKVAEAVTTTNAVPSLATDGIPVYPTNKIIAEDGHCFLASSAQFSTLMVDVSGTTPSFTLKLWGYLAASQKWYPIQGILGSAVTANYAERVLNLGHYDRLYLQATAVSGTTPSMNAWLTTDRTICY